VWTLTNVSSQELAVRAALYLNRGRLLQILLQPEDWWYGNTGRIEPPEPFRYYHGLEIPHKELDGSQHAVDWFDFEPGEGQKILAELARLGSLSRPREKWNAKVTFYKPQILSSTRQVRLSEYTALEERLLRRHEVDKSWPLSESFDTAIGNYWRIVDSTTGEVLEQLCVDAKNVTVYLPMAEPWWKRIFRG
jgi:hypothetical protein